MQLPALVFLLACLLASCNRPVESTGAAENAGRKAQVETDGLAPSPATSEHAGMQGDDFPVENSEPESAAKNKELRKLMLFARPLNGGWRFPSRYHYNEWRQATGRRDRPLSLMIDGVEQGLSIGSDAALVILIDDLGNSRWSLRRLGALSYPVNGAILPHTPLAKQAVEAIRANGGDAILHLPLEPIGYPKDDPGPGALFVTMPTEQKTQVFESIWAGVPGLIGLNNHMGSRFTSDADSVTWLARTLQGREAVFIDSRTVPGSKAHATMVAHGIPSLGRTHFLDDVPTKEAVEASFRSALGYAKANGFAVAIGHPNRNTIEILEAAPQLFTEYGVRPVSLQRLFKID